jgi:tetratricopeptide (TPR) repeat protein
MPANVDGMVREGISAYRAGRKDEARALLLRAVEIDQYNEDAWLWLSAVVESVDEQRTCLENVLTINPNNDRAKQGLQMLTQKSAPATTKSAATQADDVLASSSFTPTPSSTASSFGVDDADELPSSIEWGAPAAPPPVVAPPTATSSASSSHVVNEPSAAEYDDWVTNLNLGSNNAEEVFQASPVDAAAQFMSTSYDDDEDNDDMFSAGASTAVFGEDDDDDLFSSSGPFGNIDTSPPINNTPAPVAKSPKTAFSSKPNSALTPQKSSSSVFEDIDDDDDLGSAFDQDYDQADLDKPDAAESFMLIPKDIRPTRLPGTRERYPALAIVGLLGVILLNLGAVALLVMNLTAK